MSERYRPRQPQGDEPEGSPDRAGPRLLRSLRWRLMVASNRLRPHLAFRCGGKRYPYFCHPYNGAGLNERTVEIAIARELIREYSGRRILEVGNVLANYGPVTHTVVDKYEEAPGVLNQDIVDLDGNECYDLIVGISTIEHVGFDEEPRDPGKLARAVERLCALLAPGGMLFLTFPLAYNPDADRFWREDTSFFTRKLCLRRTSFLNFWREVPCPAAGEALYGHPWVGGNWVAIGITSR